MVGSCDNSGVRRGVGLQTRSKRLWTSRGDKAGPATGAVGQSAEVPSIALSGADGQTALSACPRDNSNVVAAWFFTHSNGVGPSRATSCVGSDCVGNAHQGMSVALSRRGNTAIIGGPETLGPSDAAWVFTSQQRVMDPFSAKS